MSLLHSWLWKQNGDQCDWASRSEWVRRPSHTGYRKVAVVCKTPIGMEQSFTLLNSSSPLIPFNITCFATRFDKFSKIHFNKAFYFTAIPVNTKHLHSPTSLTLYKCYTNVLCVLGCRLFQKVSILRSLSFKISSSFSFCFADWFIQSNILFPWWKKVKGLLFC